MLLQCSTVFEAFTACNQIAKVIYNKVLCYPCNGPRSRVRGGVEHEITLLILDLKWVTHKKYLSLFTACSRKYCVLLLFFLEVPCL